MKYIARGEVVDAWYYEGKSSMDNAPEWIKEAISSGIIKQSNGRYYVDEYKIRPLYLSDFIIKYSSGQIAAMDENLFSAMFVSVEELHNLVLQSSTGKKESVGLSK